MALHCFLKTDRAMRAALASITFDQIDGELNPELIVYDTDLVYRFQRSGQDRWNLKYILGDDSLAEAVKGLIQRSEPVPFRIPITAIHGVGATKSYSARSLDDLGAILRPGGGSISFATAADFQKNLAWLDKPSSGTRVGPPFRIVQRAWDGKYFVENANGSHHLAALHRQAKQQGLTFVLEGTLAQLSINADKCRRLLDACYLLIMCKGPAIEIATAVRPFGLRTDTTTFTPWRGGWSDSRRPDHRVVYLDKGHSRAATAHTIIRELAPPGCIFDLGAYLTTVPKE